MCCTFERRGYLVSSKRMQTVSEFIGYVNNLWGDWHDKSEKQWNPQEQLPWFRGVQKDNYELIPGIYRGQEILGWKYSDYSAGNAENMKADVEDMKAEFARRAVPFLKQHQHFRDGEYLHLMQHYRCPTRLLDWTEGALIALYFAVRISREQEKEANDKSYSPCVWMLNPSWLNYENDVINDLAGRDPKTKQYKSLVRYTDYWAMEKYHEDRIVLERYLCREEDLSAKYPIAVFPPHIDIRIVAQKSVFTIHGLEKDGFRVLADNCKDIQIAKILITADMKELDDIRNELAILGITETTLFPDLEGLSREIQAEYDMKVRYP